MTGAEAALGQTTMTSARGSINWNSIYNSHANIDMKSLANFFDLVFTVNDCVCFQSIFKDFFYIRFFQLVKVATS